MLILTTPELQIRHDEFGLPLIGADASKRRSILFIG